MAIEDYLIKKIYHLEFMPMGILIFKEKIHQTSLSRSLWWRSPPRGSFLTLSSHVNTINYLDVTLVGDYITGSVQTCTFWKECASNALLLATSGR